MSARHNSDVMDFLALLDHKPSHAEILRSLNLAMERKCLGSISEVASAILVEARKDGTAAVLIVALLRAGGLV
jgi:hypothetical protein